jgi:hypothetical protein
VSPDESGSLEESESLGDGSGDGSGDDCAGPQTTPSRTWNLVRFHRFPKAAVLHSFCFMYSSVSKRSILVQLPDILGWFDIPSLMMS